MKFPFIPNKFYKYFKGECHNFPHLKYGLHIMISFQGVQYGKGKKKKNSAVTIEKSTTADVI